MGRNSGRKPRRQVADEVIDVVPFLGRIQSPFNKPSFSYRLDRDRRAGVGDIGDRQRVGAGGAFEAGHRHEVVPRTRRGEVRDRVPAIAAVVVPGLRLADDVAVGDVVALAVVDADDEWVRQGAVTGVGAFQLQPVDPFADPAVEAHAEPVAVRGALDVAGHAAADGRPAAGAHARRQVGAGRLGERGQGVSQGV